MNGEKTTIDISTGTIIRFLLLVALFFVIYQLRDVVAVFLMSLVIASAVDPAASWLSRHKIPRVLGVLIIYILSFTSLGLLFYIVVPPLLQEVAGFVSEIPRYLETNFEPNSIISFLPQLPAGFSGILQEYVASFESSFDKATSSFFGLTAAVFGGALSFILVIVISFYLSVQERGIESFLRVVTPKNYEKYILDLWTRARRKIGLWLQGQFLLGILVGILVFLGLLILGVKYAILLAIISAIFEVIPVFGPVLAGIPAVGIAFLQKPILGVAVLVLYFVVQQFENHLIYPVVVSKTIGVPPLLVILSLIIGGTLAGFVGLFLAVPIAAVLMEFVNDVARRKEIEL